MNKSKSLLFRDFKKAKQVADHVGVTLALMDDSQILQAPDAQLVFADYSTLSSLSRRPMKKTFQTALCIIDEYDSLIFDEDQDPQQVLGLLACFKIVLGFTGSKLLDFHQQFLQKSLHCNLYDFTLSQANRLSLI